MAAIPKQRMYRALHKAGLANEKQIKEINRKLGNDPRAQREFAKLWRNHMGHRFSGTLIAFAGWLVKHWAEIKIALGIIALFLDEEPETKDGKTHQEGNKAETKGQVTTYVAPPKPQTDKPVLAFSQALNVNKVESSDDEELAKLIAEEEEAKRTVTDSLENKVSDSLKDAE